MILSLDLGSTSFKAAVADPRLHVRGFHAHAVQHRFGAGGRVELDVAEATAAVRGAISGAIASAGIRASKVRAAAVTSQAQTFTVVDKNDRPRMPFISWMDTRAAQTCERLKRFRRMRDFGQHCSFGSPVPGLQLCLIRHFRETQKRFAGPDNLILGLPAFFIYRWTGTPAVDQNLAAMSGLYSLKLQNWWPAALRLCGLQSGQLPEVFPVGAAAGLTCLGALPFGLPEGIPVVLAGNDQTAGAYAARLDENRGLLVTLGTAQAAYTYAAKMPRPDPSLYRGPFPGGGYYRMAADNCGGSVINWAKPLLSGCETDEKFFSQAAKAPPGCDGLVFDPGCDGSNGVWKNIAHSHTAADFARSILEGLARRMAELIQRLGVRLDATNICVAGGGSDNPLWVRIVSETLGARMNVSEGRPCVGAARMVLRTVPNLDK